MSSHLNDGWLETRSEQNHTLLLSPLVPVSWTQTILASVDQVLAWPPIHTGIIIWLILIFFHRITRIIHLPSTVRRRIRTRNYSRRSPLISLHRTRRVLTPVYPQTISPYRILSTTFHIILIIITIIHHHHRRIINTSSSSNNNSNSNSTIIIKSRHRRTANELRPPAALVSRARMHHHRIHSAKAAATHPQPTTTMHRSSVLKRRSTMATLRRRTQRIAVTRQQRTRAVTVRTMVHPQPVLRLHLNRPDT